MFTRISCSIVLLNLVNRKHIQLYVLYFVSFILTVLCEYLFVSCASNHQISNMLYRKICFPYIKFAGVSFESLMADIAKIGN